MGVSAGSLRFIVVDGDRDVRDAFTLTVRRLGHQADEASDGVEAIELLATEPYDFMLLGLTTPRRSGKDVMRWLRDHPEWATGLQVVVTGAIASSRRAELQALVAHTVLAKPVRAVDLRELIRCTHERGSLLLAPWSGGAETLDLRQGTPSTSMPRLGALPPLRFQ